MAESNRQKNLDAIFNSPAPATQKVEGLSKRQAMIADITDPLPGESQGFVNDFKTSVTDFLKGGVNQIARAGGLNRPVFPEPTPVDSYGYRMGRMGAESAMTAIPVGGALSRISKVEDAVGIAQKTRNFLAEIGNSFRRKPVRFVGAEGFAGSGAGGGGFFMEQRFPDSAAAQLTGELLGGATFSIAPTFLRFTPSGMLGRKLFEMHQEQFDQNLAGGRASRRIDRATGEPRVNILNQVNNTELVPGAREILPPALRANNEGLAELWRSVRMAADEGLVNEQDAEMLAKLNELIIQDLRGIGSGVTGGGMNASEAIRLQIATDMHLVDTRVRAAVRKANDTAERIAPIDSRANVAGMNQIMSDELEKAYKLARGVETDYWNRIDGDLPISTTNLREAYRNLISSEGDTLDLGKYGRLLDMRLNPKVGSNGKVRNQQAWGQSTSLKNLKTLRTDLMDEASDLRAKGRRGQANRLERLAGAILSDMNTVSVGDDNSQQTALTAARAMSRMLNEKFTSGTVARVMGLAEGPTGVRSNNALLDIFGSFGERGYSRMNEVLQATATPESREAMEDYIRVRFFENIKPRGMDNNIIGPTVEEIAQSEGMLRSNELPRVGFNVNAAKDFLRVNEQVLDTFPQLKAQIQEVVRSGRVSEEIRAAGALQLGDIRKTRSMAFIGRDPNAFWQSMFSGNVPSPRREVQNLIKAAGNDETGQALAYLKDSFVDSILNTRGVMTNVLPNSPRVEVTEPYISGAGLSALTRKPGFAESVSQLFTPEENKRLRRIMATAQRQDVARRAVAGTGAREGIMGDQPSMALGLFARLAGVRVGSELSRRLPGRGGDIQTPEIISNLFKKMVDEGIANPAREFIKKAVTDEALFNDLMTMTPRELASSPDRMRRLNAWVPVILMDQESEE